MDNPYLAPSSAAVRTRTKSQGELILRLVILVFSSYQFLSLSHHLLKNSDLVSEAISTGAMSALGLAVSLLFAFLLMLAGVLLFFSRKAAIWLFAAYLPYQLYWFVFTQSQFFRLLALASLGVLAACLYYSIRLKRNGLLR